MQPTRRSVLRAGGALAAAGAGALAGCTGDGTGDDGSGGATAQSSFFVFGDIVANVAGDAAETDLLTPVGQHGHGWEPGPRVREDIRNAALFVHGMAGFQPWVEDVLADLEADDADVTSLDVSADVDLLEAGGDDHDHDADDSEEEGHDHGTVDPHFWMDPLRVAESVGAAREGLAGVDPDAADEYAANAEAFRGELDALHGRLESTVESGSRGVVLFAGHDAFRYLEARYGVDVHALSGLSPDDRPTTRDIDRAQEVIETHGLEYICADPLEPQDAAEQLVEETDAREVLPLTSMPGLTTEWADEAWGYTEVMENVNLPALERALEA